MARTRKTPRRKDRVEKEIDTSSADAQNASLLFKKLPAEVRLLIYEHILGTGTVHIGWRNGNHVLGSGNRPSRAMPYAICQKPDDWSLTYAHSKTPPRCARKHASGSVIDDYWSRHYSCTKPLRDCTYNDYSWSCDRCFVLGQEKVYLQEQRDDNGECGPCMTKRAQMTAIYGPPDIGLGQVHAGSAFDLAILYTCKRIYHEARQLPFKLYTFDAGETKTLLAFLQTSLQPFQSAAIETIHIEETHNHAITFTPLFDELPNLKTIRISWGRRSTIYGLDSEWDNFFRKSTLKLVEISTAFKCNCFVYDFEDGVDCERERAHRDVAEKAELFLTSSSLEEARIAVGVRNPHQAAPLLEDS